MPLILDKPTKEWTEDECDRALAELEKIDTPKITLQDIFVRTKPPNSKLVRYEPNETQILYLDDIQKNAPGFDWRNDKYDLSGLRLDVLKYRQWGCSTTTIALFFIDTINNPLTPSMIMAHNPKTTIDLLNIVRIMYDNLPKGRKPTVRIANRQEYEFGNGSAISVLQVGSRGAGRGGTIKNLLESERAFWPADGNEIEFGLIQSVPRGGNIIRETTANGLENFYRQYRDAENGESDYKPLFYGWAPHKEYAEEVPPGFTQTKDEIKLQEAFDLTDGQLMFRRSKSAEAKRLGKDFRQEYPLYASEAFIASGNPYFNRIWLTEELQRLQKVKPIYVETSDQGFLPDGELRMYEKPGKSMYCVGADVAEGITDDGDHDYSTAVVRDVNTWKQVCVYRGRPEPKKFGDLLDWLSKEYASTTHWGSSLPALLIPERNNHGLVVVDRLEELGHRNLYRHKVIRTYQGNQVEETVAGYPKSVKTKVIIDDGLAEAIMESAEGLDSVQYSDRECVEELIHYVKKGNKACAEGGGHDDFVSADGLSVYGCKQCGRSVAMVSEQVDEEPMYGHRRLRR